MSPLLGNPHDERFLSAAPFMLLGIWVAWVSPLAFVVALLLFRQRGIRVTHIRLPDALLFLVLIAEVGVLSIVVGLSVLLEEVHVNRFVLSLLAGSLVAAAVAYGAAIPTGTPEGEKAPLMLSFTELKWTALPERPGMQFSVLSGDPKMGPYTQLRRVPAGTENPLHSHTSEITNVIISGTWYTGADAASAKDFGPGSVVMMPGNWVHVSGCRPGSECVFYQDGKGKFDFKPVAQSGK